MNIEQHCKEAAQEVRALAETATDPRMQATAKILDLIAAAYGEDGLYLEEDNMLDRMVAAIKVPDPYENAPYCVALPKGSPYTKLADRLADILLGVKIPIPVSTKDGHLIIPENEIIHLGMLTALAAYLIEDKGEVEIDPSPIRNKILETYQKVVSPD